MGARGTGFKHVTSWLAGALCLAVGLLALPGVAPAATTASISASFSPAQHGAAIHFRFTLTESAGGIPAIATHAILHLPKGTSFNLPRLPKKDLCSPDILLASRNEPSVCPKLSHAGPAGGAELEAIIGGKPTIVKAPVRPLILGLNGGLRELVLFLEGPLPFPTDALEVLPEKGGLGVPLEYAEVALGVHNEMIGMSVTLAGSLKIAPPASCPKGGYPWSADFTFSEGPPQTATTTSPCPGKSKAAAARRNTGYLTTLPWAHRQGADVAAHAASKLTTPFQCEKRFHQTQSRQSCFNQLPGANCAHPLVAEKAEQTTRGAHRYFKITFLGEQDGEGGLETYTYAPVKNVGICPHGVTYKVSRSGRDHCERTPAGEEYCSNEYDVKTISEPTTRTGGEFRAEVPPHMYGHIVVKGYFIHPPWEHRARTAATRAQGASAHTASTPTTPFQCEKRFHQTQSRQSCFNQLPGANCAHPLEATKADTTALGAHRDFKLTFHEERDGEGSLKFYAYAPAKNVAICPRGAVFKVSMSGREHCERTPKGEEVCGVEYDIKNIPEATTRAGGEFQYEMPAHMDGYLLVKGYFIHPPWQHRK